MEKVIGIFILIFAFAGGIYVVNHGIQSLKFDLPITAKPYKTSDYFDLPRSDSDIGLNSFSRSESRPRVRISAARIMTGPNPYTEIMLIADMISGESVRVTGWTLRNNRGESFMLPQAQEVYETGGFTRDIILKSGERVILYSTPNIAGGFRLNKCMGYLANIYSMTPPLPTSCPRLGGAEIGHLSIPCQNYITSLSSCSVSQTIPGFSYNDSSCQNFLTKLNYSGCVDLHRRESDFLSQEWRIWGGSALNLWRMDHDVVRLYDGNGQFITEYQY